MTNPKLLGIDLEGEGAHPAAWRAALYDPAISFTPARIANRIRAIERGAYSFAIIPDGPGTGFPGVQARLDAVELAAFASAVTSRLALVPAANPLHTEPYHLANQLSSLELGSKGRAGWLVRAADSPAHAAAYGREDILDDEAASREARDVVDAVRLLWDTWEDEVLIADEATGRFLDLEKWHHADFEGESFSIKGPGLPPRPRQGQLPVWVETSFDGPDPHLAGLVDVAIVSESSVAGIAAAARSAREAGVPRVIATVEVAVDTRLASAEERLRELDAHEVWVPTSSPRIVGSAEFVAASLAEVVRVVDGITIRPAVLSEDAPVIASEVRELLAEEVALHRPAAYETLREALRLDRPENRFAGRRASAGSAVDSSASTLVGSTR
ncbi:MAG: LLM class flavin-dependent oxidoreductase [Pseudoclavibacter sp.]